MYSRLDGLVLTLKFLSRPYTLEETMRSNKEISHGCIKLFNFRACTWLAPSNTKVADELCPLKPDGLSSTKESVEALDCLDMARNLSKLQNLLHLPMTLEG
ncbi:hypothetical protein ACFX1Q_020167 [Malus domestica]